MGYTASLKALAILQPHHQIILCHVQDTCWMSLILVQRYSRCILQHQWTRPFWIWTPGNYVIPVYTASIPSMVYLVMAGAEDWKLGTTTDVYLSIVVSCWESLTFIWWYASVRSRFMKQLSLLKLVNRSSGTNSRYWSDPTPRSIRWNNLNKGAFYCRQWVIYRLD